MYPDYRLIQYFSEFYPPMYAPSLFLMQIRNPSNINNSYYALIEFDLSDIIKC